MTQWPACPKFHSRVLVKMTGGLLQAARELETERRRAEALSAEQQATRQQLAALRAEVGALKQQRGQRVEQQQAAAEVRLPALHYQLLRIERHSSRSVCLYLRHRPCKLTALCGLPPSMMLKLSRHGPSSGLQASL